LLLIEDMDTRSEEVRKRLGGAIARSGQPTRVGFPDIPM